MLPTLLLPWLLTIILECIEHIHGLSYSGSMPLPLNEWIMIQITIEQTKVTILIYKGSDITNPLDSIEETITTTAVSGPLSISVNTMSIITMYALLYQ